MGYFEIGIKVASVPISTLPTQTKIVYLLESKLGSISPTYVYKTHIATSIWCLAEKGYSFFTNIFSENFPHNLGCNYCTIVPVDVLWYISAKYCMPKKIFNAKAAH